KEGLYACGNNSMGQLGLGHYRDILEFIKVNILNVLSVSCGYEFTMIITEEGLFACGDNKEQQLGLYNREYNLFTKVNILNVLSVSCGFKHTMIMTKDGLFACGSNDYGQLAIHNHRYLGKIDISNVLYVSCG